MAFLIILKLYAKSTTRHRVICIPFNTCKLAILNFVHHRTGIRTIVRAAAVMRGFHR